MAKRKSLTTTDVEEESVNPRSKASKKAKLEEEDELDGSESSPRTAKKPKYTVKAEDTDSEGVDVQCTPEGEKFIDLGKNKRVTVRNFKGSTLIDIREFYADKATQELKPGKKGISLSVDQWEELKKIAGTLDSLIVKMKK
ncbi:transcriptional Coactivator p15-domain-containing protein [Mycena maculata]|uniref:Transcriptional Coactivator p15-domain-containing protein n=1 Tax=Mycena maculata TaxID=230809 RepID=A0AAD7NQ02_9AGAR|nr:transcriptional Coactivator p15-domain-containing protein [Mycena maculata]